MADLEVYAYEKGYAAPIAAPAQPDLSATASETFAGVRKLSDPVAQGAIPLPGGDAIPEVVATHPRLGFTDAATLRTRLLDTGTPEGVASGKLDQWLNLSEWSASSYSTIFARYSAIQNFAFLAALDPAALRAAGRSGGVLDLPAYQTAAQCAQRAYDLLLPDLATITAGTDTFNDSRHVDVSSHVMLPMLFDWTYDVLPLAYRNTLRDALVGWCQNRLKLRRPWNSTTGQLFNSGALWMNGPQRDAMSVLPFLALANETDVDAALQADVWAICWSSTFETTRPSSRFHTFHDTSIAAYQSATPNTVRLDGRFGVEVALITAYGSGASEGRLSPYCTDDWIATSLIELLGRTAFVGTPPTDAWYATRRFPSYAYTTITPDHRHPARPGLWCVNDGDIGSPPGGIDEPEKWYVAWGGSVAAAHGETDEVAIANVLTETLSATDSLGDWYGMVTGYFLQPHLDVAATLPSTIQQDHSEGRLHWLGVNPTALDGTGSSVTLFASTWLGDYLHSAGSSRVPIHLDINCRGRLVLGNAISSKSGFLSHGSTKGDYWATATAYPQRWDLMFRTGAMIVNPTTPYASTNEADRYIDKNINARSPAWGAPLAIPPLAGFKQTWRRVGARESTSLCWHNARHAATDWTSYGVDTLFIRGMTPAELVIRVERHPAFTATAGCEHRYVISVPVKPNWSAGITPTDPTGSGYWEQSSAAAALEVVNAGAAIPRNPAENTWPGLSTTNGRLWITPLRPVSRTTVLRGGYDPGIYARFAADPTGSGGAAWMQDLYTHQGSAGLSFSSNPTTERAVVSYTYLDDTLRLYPSVTLDDAFKLFFGWGRVELQGPATTSACTWVVGYEFGDASAFTTRTALAETASVSAGWIGVHYPHATNAVVAVFREEQADVGTTADLPLQYGYVRVASTTRHAVCGLPSGATYSVTAATLYGTTVITVTAGGSRTATDGVLMFAVNASDVVSDWT